MKRAVMILMAALALVPYCVAQGEDAYAARAAVAEPEQSQTAVFDPSQPPSTAPSATRRGRWWGRLVPTDRSLWLLSYIADATQFSYQEVDTLETAHIKSGKGMREGKLAVKMLAGAGALGSLAAEFRKGRAKRQRDSHLKPLKSH